MKKKTYEIGNYEETNQNELINKKHRKVCRVLNYIEHWLIAVSTITKCLSISDFSSLVEIPTGIASSTIGLKVCVITTGIEKCKSIIKKIWKKHNKNSIVSKI